MWLAPVVVLLVAVAIGAGGQRIPGGRVPGRFATSPAPAAGFLAGSSSSGSHAVQPQVTGDGSVPDVTRLKLAAAEAAMREAGLTVEISFFTTSDVEPGVVVSQGIAPSSHDGTGHIVHLVVSEAPVSRKPSPSPTSSPSPRCDPHYLGKCLNPLALDYDCAGQPGNGPLFVYGAVRVVGFDHFGLDRNHDGIGCN